MSPSAAWEIEGVLATAIASASVLMILVPIVGFAPVVEIAPRAEAFANSKQPATGERRTPERGF